MPFSVFETIMSGDGEKRKSKKKSKHSKNAYDDDYVEQEVARAMKEMEKAMKQVKVAEKEARRARKEKFKSKPGPEINFTGDSSDSGMTVIHNTVTHPGTYVHVESAENIQIGSQNTMHIYKDKKSNRKPSRNDSSSESDTEVAPNLPPTPQQRTVPVHEKDPSQLSKAEKKLYDVLHSTREVTIEDITVCCEHVGNWRRFLRHLGLDDSLLEQLHQDFHVEGVRQIIYQGVLEWTRRKGMEATIGALARTLQKVDYTEAVFYLKP